MPIRLLLPTCALLTGCGTLLGAEGLRQVDHLVVPRNLAWEVRWLGDDGLVGPCELIELDEDDVDLAFLPFGQIDFTAPAPGVPATNLNFGSATVAIGVPVAVTRGSSDVTTRSATEQAPLDSVFGAPSAVWIDVTGSAQDASDALGTSVSIGGQWRDVLDAGDLRNRSLFAAFTDAAPSSLPALIVPRLDDVDPELRDLLEFSALPPCP